MVSRENSLVSLGTSSSKNKGDLLSRRISSSTLRGPWGLGDHLMDEGFLN
jgi:hypothetical protein